MYCVGKVFIISHGLTDRESSGNENAMPLVDEITFRNNAGDSYTTGFSLDDFTDSVGQAHVCRQR